MIKQYFRELSDSTIQRIINEPLDKWGCMHYINPSGCRCLVGIAEDFRYKNNEFPQVFDRQAQKAYDFWRSKNLKRSIEDRFDRIYLRIGKEKAVALVQKAATQELERRYARH